MKRDRDRMLLAFKTEDERLTRRDVMARAGVSDPQAFQSMLDTRVIQKDEWEPNRPNHFHLTPLGIDRREAERELCPA
jgi:hypothetical protein